MAQVLVDVLKGGENLKRENIMYQAADIKELEINVLIPGAGRIPAPTTPRRQI